MATTFPDGEDWGWKAIKKAFKKGDVVLPLKTLRWEGRPILFVFKESSVNAPEKKR